MEHKRDGLVPIGEVSGGLKGPVKALCFCTPFEGSSLKPLQGIGFSACELGWTSHGPDSNLRSGLVPGGRSTPKRARLQLGTG